MNRANFATPLSISPFGLGSVITSSTRWLSHEDWTEGLSSWFGQSRPVQNKTITKTPKSILSKSKKQSAVYGCWILSSPATPDLPLAWAEVHGFSSSFAKVFLIVSAPSLPDEQAAYFKEALLVLVTAAGLWGHLDVVDVYFAEKGRDAFSDAVGATKRTCYMINDPDHWSGATLESEAFTMLSIDMFEWLKSTASEEKQNELTQLKTLVRLRDKREAADKQSAKRPRRGIIERLFSPWSR